MSVWDEARKLKTKESVWDKARSLPTIFPEMPPAPDYDQYESIPEDMYGKFKYESPALPPSVTGPPVKPIIPEAVSRDILAVRGGKQLLNQLILSDIERGRPSTAITHDIFGLGASLEAAAEIKSPEEFNALPTWGKIKALPKMMLAARKGYYSPEAREVTEVADQLLREQRGAVDFDVGPPETVGEKVVDVGAGLSAFIVKVVLTKKILPAQLNKYPNLLRALSFEMANTAGRPGEGAAMAAVIGLPGSLPGITTAQKAFRLSMQSGALAGYTKLKGGSSADVVISALIPIAFAALGGTEGKLSDYKMVKTWRQRLPFSRDISLKSSMKMAQAMRAMYEIKGRPEFRQAARLGAKSKLTPQESVRLGQLQIKMDRAMSSWSKAHAGSYNDFNKLAVKHWEAHGPKPIQQIAGKTEKPPLGPPPAPVEAPPEAPAGPPVAEPPPEGVKVPPVPITTPKAVGKAEVAPTGKSADIIETIKAKSDDTVITFYHGTSPEGEKAIRKSGELKPDNLNSVGLATTKDVAKEIAREKAGDAGVVLEVQVKRSELGGDVMGDLVNGRGMTTETDNAILVQQQGKGKKWSVKVTTPKAEGKVERKEAEARFVALTRAPTPVKDRLKISTMQLLREQRRTNILSEEEYIAKLNKLTKTFPTPAPKVEVVKKTIEILGELKKRYTPQQVEKAFDKWYSKYPTIKGKTVEEQKQYEALQRDVFARKLLAGDKDAVEAVSPVEKKAITLRPTTARDIAGMFDGYLSEAEKTAITPRVENFVERIKKHIGKEGAGDAVAGRQWKGSIDEETRLDLLRFFKAGLAESETFAKETGKEGAGIHRSKILIKAFGGEVEKPTKPQKKAPAKKKVREKRKIQPKSLKQYRQETKQQLKNDPIYNIEGDALDLRTREIDTGIYWLPEKFRGEAKNAIENHPVLRFHITYDRSKGTPYDAAMMETMGEEVSVDEFLDRVGEALSARKKIGGISVVLLNIMRNSEIPESEIIAMKHIMLHDTHENYTIKEIDEAIVEVAERNGIDATPFLLKEHPDVKASTEISEAVGEGQAGIREATDKEIEDFAVGLDEPPKRQTDLLDRPIIQGGAAGEQGEFLAKEDYKTLKEKERIVAEKDLKGQQTFPPSGKAGSPAKPRRRMKLQKESPAQRNVTARKIIAHLEKALKVPIRGMATHRTKKYAGWYDRRARGIRQIDIHSIETAAHEVGHHIDHYTKIRTPRKDVAGRTIYRAPAGTGKELVALGKALYGKTKPPGGYASEGVAEFVKGYIAGHIDAKSEAPKFHKWFTEDYLKNNPEIAEALHLARDLITTWREQGASARIRSQRVIGDIKLSIKERIIKVYQSFATALSDKFLPIRYGMKKAGIIPFGEKGSKLTKPTEDPYFLTAVFGDKAGAKTLFHAENGVTDMGGNIVGPSLSEVLKPVAKDIEKFFDWAHAAMAIEMAKLGQNAGIDMGDAQYVYNRDKSPVYEKALADVSNWSRVDLDLYLESGVIEKKLYDAIIKKHPIHLPMLRAFIKGEIRPVGGGKTLQPGKPFYKRKGSGRPIEDFITSLLVQRERAISVSQKAMIVKALANLAKGEGVAGLIWRVPAPKQATKFTAERIKKDILKIANKHLGLDLEGIPPSMFGQWDDLITVFTNAATYHGKDNLVRLQFGDEVTWYEIDPGLFRVLKGLDIYRLPWYVDIVLGWPTRVARLGVTGLNASFGLIRNFWRDLRTFTVLAKHAKLGPVSGIIGVAKDVGTDIAGIAEVFNIKGLPKSRYVQKWKALGGEMSVQVIHDRRGQKHLRQKVLASSGVTYTIHTFLHPVDATRSVLGITESGTRIGEFEPALKYGEKKWGKGSKDAAFYALYMGQDVTTPFTRSGHLGQKINQVVFFFNAGIQGPLKLLRTVKARPWRFTLLSIVTMTIPALWNWWRNKDKEWYKNMAPYEKYGYEHFEDPLDPNAIYRFPVPFELGHVFISIPVAHLDALYKKDPEEVKRMFEQLLKDANPLDIPTAAKPIWEIGINKDFAGKPIVPRSVEGKEADLQYKPYTTELMKLLGKQLKMSPAQIEHLVNSYSGGVYGRTARALAGDDREQTKSDIPVLGTLYLRDPYAPKAQIENFYERLNELSRKKQSDRLVGSEKSEWRYYYMKSRILSRRWRALRNVKTVAERKRIYALIKKHTEAAAAKTTKKKK